MEKKRTVLVKFFLTYVTIVVPVLLVSIFATGVILKEMFKMEEEMQYRQLVEVKNALAGEHANYYDEGIVIASRTELHPNKMLGELRGVREGLEVLKLKSYFDGDILDVFVTYETDKVYSATGVARKTVYFRDSLNCNEESTDRGIKAVESNEDRVTLLFDKRSGGKLLYSYKIYRPSDASTSVNFVMDFSRLEELIHITSKNQYFELETADGSAIIFGRDENSEFLVCEAEAWRAQTNLGQYTIFAENMEKQGMVVRLYYDKMAVSMGHWLYKVQAVNIALVLVGLTWSLIFSWLYSRKQMREIILLENTAKGEMDISLPSRNVYHDLQSLILQGFYENQKLEESVMEHKEQLQGKIKNMIFHGLFNEPEKLELAFREVGFDHVPDRFFVGAVSAETSLQREHVEALFDHYLWLPVLYEERGIIIFLCELQRADENQLQRKAVGEEIRRYLHQKGIHKIRIGMSQVYSNPAIIDCAYTEAIQMLGRLLKGEEKDYFVCWENGKPQSMVLLPDDTLLTQFGGALREQDYDAAVEIFHQLLHSGMIKGSTQQNKNYLRYEILQKVVQYLNEEKTTDKQILLKECINIHVDQERDFTNAVTNILQKALPQKESDSFGRILKYIDQNYQNSDLTYEEVAEAGGISKNYISKMFRTRLGMSYIEYITLVRLEKACSLLRTTDENISAVAELVGYANAASFRRAFKMKYGVSASDYRNKENQY